MCHLLHIRRKDAHPGMLIPRLRASPIDHGRRVTMDGVGVAYDSTETLALTCCFAFLREDNANPG